jgi:hypothetical protein
MKESRHILFDHADIAEDNRWTVNVGNYPKMLANDPRTGDRRSQLKQPTLHAMDSRDPMSNYFLGILTTNCRPFRTIRIYLWIQTSGLVILPPQLNMKNTRGGITVGKIEVTVAKKTGDIPCESCDRHGNMVHTGKITDVALIKSCPCNLFSVTKMMREGWKWSGDGENGITLSKGGNSLSFDVPVATPKGVIHAMYVRRSDRANPALVTTMNVEKAHCLLGHQSEDTTRKIAKCIGWEITKGALKPCLSCSIGKAKQKNTVKDSDHVKCKAPGERIFTDIAFDRPVEGIKVSKPH